MLCICVYLCMWHYCIICTQVIKYDVPYYVTIVYYYIAEIFKNTSQGIYFDDILWTRYSRPMTTEASAHATGNRIFSVSTNDKYQYQRSVCPCCSVETCIVIYFCFVLILFTYSLFSFSFFTDESPCSQLYLGSATLVLDFHFTRSLTSSTPAIEVYKIMTQTLYVSCFIVMNNNIHIMTSGSIILVVPMFNSI